MIELLETIGLLVWLVSVMYFVNIRPEYDVIVKDIENRRK